MKTVSHRMAPQGTEVVHYFSVFSVAIHSGENRCNSLFLRLGLLGRRITFEFGD